MLRNGSSFAHRYGTWIAIAVALPVLTGCGSRSYPVEGKIVWGDESPATELAGGLVSFSAEEARISAGGEIQPDATFTLSSLKKGDGLPPGRYQVLVMPPEPTRRDDQEGPRPKPRPVLDRRYQDYRTSGLEVTVESKKNDVRLTLERAKR